jgi:hypothetical protein
MIFKWVDKQTRMGGRERVAMIVGRTTKYRVAYVTWNSTAKRGAPESENYIAMVMFFESTFTAKRATMEECEAWATAKLNELIGDLA